MTLSHGLSVRVKHFLVFTFTSNNRSIGIHVDDISDVVQKLGLALSDKPVRNRNLDRLQVNILNGDIGLRDCAGRSIKVSKPECALILSELGKFIS